MAEDEGTAPRRRRRRAVRPAGSAAGVAVSPEAVSSEAVSSEVVSSQGVTRETEPEDVPTGPSVEKESATPEPAAPTSESEEQPRTRRRGVVSVALFLVVVVGLLDAGIYLFLGNRASDADNARDERFVQTARQTVLNLTTIHPDSAQEDVDRLLAGASGDFKAEFEGREGPFVDVVKQARVDSNGEIIEAGIERSSEGSAEVLVAARAMVQNSDAAEPAPRDFRLRVTVTENDGVMTASRVEFVP